MEIDRKMLVEQEQIDIDDEMAEDEDGESDDNIWLGRLGALLSPCRPLYHSTRQPLYPELSAEAVQAEALSRLIAKKLHEQNQAIIQQATAITMASQMENNRSIHFKNADLTITKIRRSNPIPSEHKYKTEMMSHSLQPISVAGISNGNISTLHKSRFSGFSSNITFNC